MSFTETWGRPGVGILPLQHREYDSKGWDLASRASKRAVRVIDRLVDGEGIGEWVFDEKSAGDLTQWLCWPNKEGNGGRQMPGWAQVWPAVTKKSNNVATPGGRPSTPTGTGQPVPTPGNPGLPPVASEDTNFNVQSSGAGASDLGDFFGNSGGAAGNAVASPQVGGAAPTSSHSSGAANRTGGYNGNLTVGINSSPATINGTSIFHSGFAGFSYGGSSSTSSLSGIPGIGFSSGFAGFTDPQRAPNQGASNGLYVHIDPINPNSPGPGGPVGDPGAPGDPGDSTPHQCGMFSGDYEILPLHDEDMSPDKRYAPLKPITPEGDSIPKFAKGIHGLVVSATNEEKQIEYFFPTWTGQLIAVNQAGDPRMGTLVCDLNGDFEIDNDRTSALQSIMRVVKRPSGGANALGWNIAETGCGDTRGGFVGDKPEGDGEYGYGLASVNDGGPFSIGSKKDKHRKGTDADKHVINSLHISTKALFRKDDAKDGPLRFENTYIDGSDLDVITKVHLGWTGVDWAWYSSCQLRDEPTDWPKPPMPPDYPNFHINPISPTYPNVPTFSPVTPIGPNDVATPATTSTATGTVPGATQFTGELPGTPQKYTPVSTGGEIISQGSTNTAPIAAAAATMALMSPGIVAQAQNYSPGQENTGMFAGGTASGKSKGADTNPVSGVMSAFAAQGGTTAGGGSSPPPGTGSQGDPWNYTNPPRGQSGFGSNASGNFRSGTASGGWIIHPPETDLRDAVAYGMVPPNKTMSTTYLITAPNAYFGSGTPELVSGSIRSGYSWGMDSSTGDLIFRSHSFSETPVTAVRFTNTSQTIVWYATKTNWGELTHSNTGNRTYTFPNTSGTVHVGISTDAAGGGAAATLGTIGGSGPTTAAMSAWEKIIRKDGTTAWVPTWI